MGGDVDAGAAQRPQHDGSARHQRGGDPAREVPAAPGVLKSVVFGIGGVVRMAGAEQVGGLGVVAAAGVLIFDHEGDGPIDENGSVPHDFLGKFGGATVLLKRAPEGTGIIAGGPARSILELAGIKNIRTKSLGSNNKQNVVLATIEGLKSMKTPEEVARLRGKSVSEILG